MGALYEIFLSPFVEFGFMSRALFGAIFLAVATGPLGVFLILRRIESGG